MEQAVMQSPQAPSFRASLWAVLHHGQGRLGHIFSFLLALLILISVAILPLQYLEVDEQFKSIMLYIEIGLVAIFTGEYLLRLYAAPKRLRYIFSFFGMVDLLSIVPFYAGFFGMESIRLLRAIRLFKLPAIEAAATAADASSMSRDIGLIEGESVEYVIARHPLYFLFACIPTMLAFAFGVALLVVAPGQPAGIAGGLALLLFGIVFLWKAWLDYSYDVIYLTNYRLLFINQHILGRGINQVNYSAITNVKPAYPGPLSYILGYGSLVIDTAAEHPGQISLHFVRGHEKAAHRIMEKSFKK